MSEIQELERIQDQAELLSRRALELKSLRRQLADDGYPDPSPRAMQDAGRSLQSAFMAVIRVTAAHL